MLYISIFFVKGEKLTMRSTTLRRLNARGRRLLAIPSLFVLAMALASPAAAASFSAAGMAVTSPQSTGVEICGQGPAVVRPSSAILACADHGTIAERLHWSSWTGTQAMATGIVTWRTCFMDCAGSKDRDSTTADVTLTDPAPEPGRGILFTRLDMHVTGPTPPGFMRNVVYNEAPLPPPHISVPAVPQEGSSPVAPPSQPSAAPSGMLGYAQIAGFWVDADGPSGSDPNVPGYTYPQVAAAITYCESTFQPGAIQPGEPYSTTGWGLWQITPGNSVPQWGTDYQVLDPWNNAEEAVYKFDAAGGFSPWTTYTNDCFSHYLQTTSPDTQLTDPGEYEQVGSAPSGTPSSPAADPGSTYGPPMAAAYAFWEGGGPSYDLWEAQGAAVSNLTGPTDRRMGPLGSAPAVGVDGSNGYTYVYWVGAGPSSDLWEAYWNGSSWVGPFNRGMGPLGSEPSVAVSRNGTAYVFWEGTNGELYEAQGPADGTLSGPYNRGMGPLGSAPTAGVDGFGNTFVYWKGQGPSYDLWQGYWNGSGWVGPFNRGQGPLNSPPTVAIYSYTTS
jgi:hypothetical protein